MTTFTMLFVFLVLSWMICFVVQGNHFIAYRSDWSTAHVWRFMFFFTPPLIFGFHYIALKPFSAGGDTYEYLKSFSQISSPLTATVDANYGPELFFWPLQALIKLVFDARGWYCAHFLIVTTLYYFSYRSLTEKTRITAFIFPLIFLTYFVVYGANAMRQVYSIPLGIIAFHFAYSRQYIRFLIFSGLSVAFHWSAFVIILAPAILMLPNRAYIYVLLPILALLASYLVEPIAVFLLWLTGFGWLQEKVNAYVHGVRVSHIQSIWLTLNFWLCVFLYLALLVFRVLSEIRYEKVMKYLLLFSV